MAATETDDRLAAGLQQRHEDLVARIRQLSLENRELGSLVRSLLEANPFAVVMFDANRHLINMNRAAEELLGVSRSALVGRRCNDIFECHDEEKRCPVLEQDQTILQQDTFAKTPAARDRDLLRSCALVREQDQPMLIESFIDITDIRRAQQENDRILRAKENFLALVSHELRTPLNAILGAGELLLDEPAISDDPDLSSLTTTSVHATRHLIRIVNTIIDYSKLISGKLVLEPETINIQTMFSDLFQISAASAQRHKNELTWEVAEDAQTVVADEHRLQHVIFQALENANEFTQNGRVHLQALHQDNDQGKWLLIRVSDTGCGIDDDALERVFNLFELEELDYSTHGTGFGLGLCVARHMVQAMGGDIEVDSEKGKGTTLTVRLPA